MTIQLLLVKMIPDCRLHLDLEDSERIKKTGRRHSFGFPEFAGTCTWAFTLLGPVQYVQGAVTNIGYVRFQTRMAPAPARQTDSLTSGLPLWEA